MDLLKQVSQEFPLSREIQILSVFHLLETSIPFFETIGQAAELKTVIAIPYSVSPETIKKYKLKFKNTSFLLPDSIDKIQSLIIEQYKKLSKKKPIIIIEVGGYSASIIKDLQAINPNLIGVVEDTNQGHWAYEKVINELSIPVYSIAQSKIKSLENRLIGKAIVFSFEDILRTTFYKTYCGLSVTVIGYGKIGKSVCRSLRNRDAIIKVWDTNPVHRFQARLDGYVSPKTKEEALLNSELIVGVSGNHSLSIEQDIEFINDKAILVSGSSKDIEFKHDNLIHYLQNEKSNGTFSSLFLGDKSISIINKGRPVNFLNNSVLASVLELIFAELYLCVFSILENPKGKGINQVDNKFHNYLCRQWENIYLPTTFLKEKIAYETV